jgi:ADP-ribose pyrophosphatase YjhB (NUDIX family)
LYRRRYPDKPIATVGALVIDEEGRVLLIKRGREPDKGLWSVPGGVIKLGEGVRDAAVRETMEETGVKVDVLEPLCVVDKIVYDKLGKIKFHYIAIDFHAKFVGGKLNPSSDILDAKWVRLADVEKFNLTKGAKEIIKKILPPP